MAHALQQPKFKIFDKYDFVKSFVAVTHDSKAKEEEEKKAAIIADAIQETQNIVFENLVTKDDLKTVEMSLKRDIQMLEISLRKDMQSNLIKLGSLMIILLTFLPLLNDFIGHLFGF
jgi:hypothetical protein